MWRWRERILRREENAREELHGTGTEQRHSGARNGTRARASNVTKTVRRDDVRCCNPSSLLHGHIARCSQKHRRRASDSRMLSRIAITTCDKETDMDSTKKVVEPPKSATPPVKAQPQPQHDAAKPSREQPKPKT